MHEIIVQAVLDEQTRDYHVCLTQCKAMTARELLVRGGISYDLVEHLTFLCPF